MKFCRIHAAGIAVLLAVMTAVGGFDAVAHASGTNPPAHHTHRGQRHGSHIRWQQHDRAVYVVSTLNAAACSSTDQLSAVLWHGGNARLFDVLQSTARADLYFVEARTATGSLVGVYAYQFGWKLPQGVAKAECVQPAASQIVAQYTSHSFQRVAEFHTTFPR